MPINISHFHFLSTTCKRLRIQCANILYLCLGSHALFLRSSLLSPFCLKFIFMNLFFNISLCLCFLLDFHISYNQAQPGHSWHNLPHTYNVNRCYDDPLLQNFGKSCVSLAQFSKTRHRHWLSTGFLKMKLKPNEKLDKKWNICLLSCDSTSYRSWITLVVAAWHVLSVQSRYFYVAAT